MLIKAGTITQEESEKALENQVFTTNAKLAALNADLVSESVTEDLELKKKQYLLPILLHYYLQNLLKKQADQNVSVLYIFMMFFMPMWLILCPIRKQNLGLLIC